MKIEHIAAAFPSRKVTNEDILEMIKAESSDSSGDLPKILKYVQRALKASGSDSRYWLAACRAYQAKKLIKTPA